MAGRRLALVMAVDEYTEPGLRQLRSPAADADALAGVLADPQLGGFEVTVVHNARSSTICEHVEEILAGRARDDLVVLHFSGHGLKDEGGDLYLAATNTAPDRLASTAVDAVLVNRLMQRSAARRVLLLLDCCYGGAFEHGMFPRAGGRVDVGERFGAEGLGEGRGRAVITASTAMEYAFEGSRLADGQVVGPSVFTGAVVAGIRSGDADRDQDGQVALGELYEYVFDQVRARAPYQTPSKWEFGTQGGWFIARNPRRRSPAHRLPRELAHLIAYPTPAGRLGAVAELARLAPAADLPLAVAARQALGRLLEDTDPAVAAAASEALDRATGNAIAPAAPPSSAPPSTPTPQRSPDPPVPPRSPWSPAPAPAPARPAADPPRREVTSAAAPGPGLVQALGPIKPPRAAYGVSLIVLLLAALSTAVFGVVPPLLIALGCGAAGSAGWIAVRRRNARHNRRVLGALVTGDRLRS